MAYVVIEERCRMCHDGMTDLGYPCGNCLTTGWVEVYVHEDQTPMEIPIGPDDESPRSRRPGVQVREV